MENSLVSVVIPTYNRAKVLKETISSALRQTYDNFEIIVIDDGSADNTESVVKNFEDKRVTYIKQSHKNAPTAKNKGILVSKGDYIAFLDSDDVWLPEKIEKQMKVFRNNKLNPSVVYCGIGYINEDGAEIKGIKLPAYRGNIFLKLLGTRRNVVLGAGSTVLIKRECFERCGLFDENLSYRIDLDLLIRISKVFAFDYVPEVLAKIRMHEKRMSSNVDNILKGRELLFKKIYNDIKKHRKILAKYYYQTAVLYFRKKDGAKGREYVMKSIRAFPLFRAIKAFWKHR